MMKNDGMVAGLQVLADAMKTFELEPSVDGKVVHATELRRLSAAVEASFTQGDWESICQFVSDPSIIKGHSRLLRSLYFGDDDYGTCVQEVLLKLDKDDPENISAIMKYMSAMSVQAGVPDVGDRIFQEGESVLFKCDKPLTFVRELGQGGTGKALLFRDETADLLFAMKKFDPSVDNDSDDCYKRFVEEIKILLRVSHPHIVRIYNYYLYSKAKTGYIQMEFVEGVPISKFEPSANTKTVPEIFSDIVSAFETLESTGILHRGVRPENLLVTSDGDVKLIDFGFGKRYGGQSTLRDNSICLNWPYAMPDEVAYGRYDRATEVYYVGELFKHSLEDWGLAETFPFAGVVAAMVESDPSKRLPSFAAVRAAMSPMELVGHKLSDNDLEVCKDVLKLITNATLELDASASAAIDPASVLERLDSLLASCELEDNLPDVSLLIKCFVSGSFNYWPHVKPNMDLLRSFRSAFAAMPPASQRAVMRNVELRLNLIPRESDEIPF